MWLLMLFDPLFLVPAGAAVLVWAIGPRWLHPLILLAVAAVLLLLWPLLWRRAARHRAETAAAAPPEDGWRWVPGMAPALFIARCGVFLRLHGWRVTTSRVTESGDAELLVQKDRARVVLHCLRPGVLPGNGLFAALAEARAAAFATRAAVVCTERTGEALGEEASRREILLFRNEDFEKFEPLLAER